MNTIGTLNPDVSATSLAERLNGHLASSRLLLPGSGITVALSGGLDSVVLLDLLLTLRGHWSWTITAAHFDHRMRQESGADAHWVASLCERLGVDLELGRAARPLENEVEARERRYAFLLRARERLGGELLATAHHADDQAETVLFRILRGTGLRGLAGIPASRPPSVVRPLLPFWRSELEAHARARGLAHRADRTNLDLSYTRNRLRHRLIPEIERAHVPDFRRRLHDLGRSARRARRVLDEFVEAAVAGMTLEESKDRIVVARRSLLAYDKGVRPYLLRHIVARIGPRPGRGGTRTALQFINHGSSGRRIVLTGGVRISREFDRLIIERASGEADRQDRVAVIVGAGEGREEAVIADRRWRVRWGEALQAEPDEAVARFALERVRFPLVVRGWEPGDRIHLDAGRRKLKRLFVDRRVGRFQRDTYPVLADGEGVLWVVGLVCGARAAAGEGRALTVCLRRT